MGLFGRKKAKVDPQVVWLNKVDAAYQRAFQVKNVTGLANYLTRPCLSIMMERVRLGEKAYAGLDRYRHVTWVKGAVKPEGIQWFKEIQYDQIKMSHGIVVPVGDEGKELWIIINEEGQDRVSEIRSLA